MRALLHRFLRSRRGTSAIEFAIVLPVMLLFVAGIVEIGRAFQVYNAVNRLATRYAISWADCSDVTLNLCGPLPLVGELSLYVTPAAITNMAPQLTNPVTLRMMEVKMVGSTAVVVYAYPLLSTPTASELAIAQTNIGSGNTGVIVTATYTHSLIFFAQLMSPMLGSSRTITYTVAQRKN